jgi:hypothetical protein
MACIKYLGLCPCPDCGVLKLELHLIGSKSDMHARQQLLWTDSDDRHRKVELACHKIIGGVNITSQKIEQALGSGSLVPTRVWIL